MNIPEDIGIDYIQSSILRLLNKILPHLPEPNRRNREANVSETLKRLHDEFNSTRDTYFRSASRVVNGAGNEDSPLAIDENGLLIISHTAMSGSKTSQCGHENEEQQPGNRESFHGFDLLFNFEALKNLNRNTDLLHWFIVATN